LEKQINMVKARTSIGVFNLDDHSIERLDLDWWLQGEVFLSIFLKKLWCYHT
jgi:hypothetical protein